jgi:hypothetical protein
MRTAMLERLIPRGESHKDENWEPKTLIIDLQIFNFQIAM